MSQQIKKLEQSIISSNTGGLYPVEYCTIGWYGYINKEIIVFPDLLSLYNSKPDFIIFERTYKKHNESRPSNVLNLFFDGQVQSLDNLIFDSWKVIAKVCRKDYWKDYVLEDRYGEKRVHEFTTSWEFFLAHMEYFISEYADWNEFDKKNLTSG